jgi:hypothetical protein
MDDNTQHEMARFSDFAESDGRLDGEKVRIEDVLGKELTIKTYCIRPSKYNNDYLTIQFQYELGSDNHVLFTGSTILSEQLRKYEEKLPFIATIEKIGKYYSFV